MFFGMLTVLDMAANIAKKPFGKKSVVINCSAAKLRCRSLSQPKQEPVTR